MMVEARIKLDLDTEKTVKKGNVVIKFGALPIEFFSEEVYWVLKEHIDKHEAFKLKELVMVNLEVN